ncbi:hypothetical protein Patl1_12288 [Pistacia atlantica]|uniref:Uncharacterized protein n=1 Tax=Pistacia atlantica TaxID=434234 RepID=A0ACC1A0V7_9ROSI|nr:hypothetical protein Patl1_12288 [Pistacia atlantica]
MSLQSMGSGRTESSFSDMSISSGGSGTGFGLSTDAESFSSNSKGMCPLSGMNSMSMLLIFYGLWISLTFILSSTTAPPNGRGMPLAAPPPTDPITLIVEEKLNVTLILDGGMGNFDVQETLSLQILNQEDGLIQAQMLDLTVIAEGLTLISRFAVNVVAICSVISLQYILRYFSWRLE